MASAAGNVNCSERGLHDTAKRPKGAPLDYSSLFDPRQLR
jgi:hypothetical protein